MSENVLSLFCGAGGASLGFQNAGYDVVLGVDTDRDAVETYRENVGDVVQRDLSQTPPSDLPVQRSEVDVVIGGPPCQDFSTANIFSRGGERTNMVFVFADYVNYFTPRVFVMENVVGMKTLDGGAVLDSLLDEFDGYDVTVVTLTASDYGDPQRRERVFVVGMCDGTFKSPEWSVSNEKTVGEAFDGLESLAAGESSDTDPNHVAPNHADKTVRRVADTEWGEQLYDSWKGMLRLDPNEPAPTLKANASGGFHYGHPYDDRALTVRERCRLQSFPDDFTVLGPVTSQRSQIGNATPLKMAEAVADNL
jgi:DNA (cytosine-5)-methyltransferase 1